MREFSQLVQAHQGRVYSLVLRMVRDSGLAEEVAQDVFLELHASLDHLAGEEHVLAWLRRVAVHRATDALRRRSVRIDSAAEEFEDGRTEVGARAPYGLTTYGSGRSSGSALNDRVEDLLATLPPVQQAVILLRYQEDLLPAEIAELLSKPVATVKSHLQRGLQLLRTKAEHTLKEYSRVRD